jgi:acyl carrier protein
VQLSAFPLTPSGKVDRKALPAPDGDAYSRGEYEAPDGAIETILAEIWSSVLEVARVSRHDHFFDLGGHSLRAIQVIARLRQRLGIDVSLAAVFEHPVLADLARTIQQTPLSIMPPIEPVDRRCPLSLSFAQQRLWFLEQLGGLGSTYHIDARLRLRGEIDVRALRRALDTLVARHEPLRTTFAVVNGEPEQRIAPVEASRFALSESDLREHDGGDVALQSVIDGDASAPFDLEHGPLIRGHLVRLRDDEHALLLTMHHIVADGWSLNILTRELGALYAAFRGGEADPLPPLPLQYADYAAWQRRLEGDVLQRQGDYWRQTLTGAPELLELPTDHPRPTHQNHAGALLAVTVDRQLTTDLKSLSQRHGTTLFATVVAAWAAVLSRLSGQREVVIGTPTANRNREEIEHLIGCFVNTLALRVNVSDAPSVRELLAHVKARTVAAQQHQDIPFEQVVDLVKPTRSLGHEPLFQTMLSWQTASEGHFTFQDLDVRPLRSSSQVTAKSDLTLNLTEWNGQLVGSVEYATALWESSTIARYVGYLETMLRHVAADDTVDVTEVPLLGAAEREQIIEAWNATACAYPADVCIHELFEAQVDRAPEAIAGGVGAARNT